MRELLRRWLDGEARSVRHGGRDFYDGTSEIGLFGRNRKGFCLGDKERVKAELEQMAVQRER